MMRSFAKQTKMNKTFQFLIEQPDDPSAGIIGFSDIVTIQVESGDPGGEPGEFEEHMKEVLSEWFDGAKVSAHK